MISWDYEVLLSGIFASFGSVFGKLSSSLDDITSHAVSHSTFIEMIAKLGSIKGQFGVALWIVLILSGLVVAELTSSFEPVPRSRDMDASAIFCCVMSLILRLVFILLMLTCNTCGMMFYVRALHNHTSSLKPTLGTAAVNYICSASAGFLLFGEAISLLWWCGTSCIIAGLTIIFKTSVQVADDKKSD